MAWLVCSCCQPDEQILPLAAQPLNATLGKQCKWERGRNQLVHSPAAIPNCSLKSSHAYPAILLLCQSQITRQFASLPVLFCSNEHLFSTGSIFLSPLFSIGTALQQAIPSLADLWTSGEAGRTKSIDFYSFVAFVDLRSYSQWQQL